MKKTFRMPLLCCLMIAVMLTVSACFVIPTPEGTTPQATTPDVTTPEATTPETTTPEATTPEQTTPPEPIDPDKPKGAVLVESVNGKSAAELLEQFSNDFKNAESLDFSATMESTENGVNTTEYVSIKYYNGNLAAASQSEEMTAEFYFIDGMFYMNLADEKFKMPAASVEEILGEDFLSSFQDGLNDFPEEKLNAAEKANIYLLDGLYIITIHTTDEETDEEQTLRCYFNAEGELVRMEGFSENEYAIFEIKSYNKPVEINPPADADAYPDFGSPDDGQIPEDAIPVDSVNGMTSEQLLNKFFEEYPKSTTFDIEVITQQYVDDEVITLVTAVKIGENAFYFLMQTEGEMMEMWAIDSTAYVNIDGQKIKQENVDTEELFDSASFESIINSIIREMPDVYYSFVKDAQLYYYEEYYFFMIAMELDGESFTETVFFDENGKVVCVIDETDEVYVMYTVNSYGDPVEILPPEDADEYVTEDEIPDDTVVPEIPENENDIYALYTEVSTAAQEADHFLAMLEITDVYYMWYKVAGEDMSVSYSTYDDKTFEQWFIDGVAYACTDYETIYKTDADEAFFEMFASFEENFPFATLAKEEIQNLSCSYFADFDCIMIRFDYTGKPGYSSVFKYFFSADLSEVEVSITEFAEGTEDITAQYYFNITPDSEIELPE